MTANKSFEERLTALITDVYNSHEEPHSSSSVINETVDFIKNIIQQERREAKKEERRAVVEEAINLVSGMQFSLGGLGGTEGGMHYNRAITNVVSKLEALKTF